MAGYLIGKIGLNHTSLQAPGSLDTPERAGTWVNRNNVTMKRTYLGEFEEIVLLIVAVLDGHAYGVNITHEIISQTGRTVRLNQVHSSLQRLEEKGVISSYMGEPTAERGGRRKRLFTITANGRQTLHEIQALRTSLWNLLPPSVKILSV